MPEAFDAFRYIGYMRSRWRWIAVSCATAVVLALVVTVNMPRQYTATARIVIDPPAGADLRSAMAVSPVYLESLKTYEEVASGDSLFQQAMQRFDLHSMLGAAPMESMKKRVLKVDLVRNTRILEISGTLPDASKAQALAQFMADSTVSLTRSVISEGDHDLLRAMEEQERETRERLAGIEKDWAQSLANEPINQLQADLKSNAELRATLEQQVVNVQQEIADAAEREKSAAGAELLEIRREASNAHARLDEIQKQLQLLTRRSAEQEKVLAGRLAHRDKLDNDRKTSLASLTAIETRLREARGDAGYRGERLRVIDPGTVPERPSSPSLPLNVGAALLLGLVLPILYLTLQLGYEEQRAGGRRSVLRTVAKARDE
ncbi:MAG TPA: Wzz/FepE/Etk N-terminal domain-containing protein [Bryobacteraceae bacterium]|nr:Wzz/FepE/Etk N-terminal domain-containing protein [Bryobacteraceae bacterium]